ncbi:MAG: LL-diaminopimelate aminotransferase [Actinobacteria bacterium]|nr:LL-diaminopimelate aminotransferase [Actinomycetota bacterium]
MKVSNRISELPPYLFAEIDRRIEEKRDQGIDVINFGVGDPDLPTPAHIVKVLCEEAYDPSNHRYPSYQGMRRFREAVAAWMEGRFGITADPDREVLALIGSKEGIAHFPMAFMDPGDFTLIPNPSYPVYRTATTFCGGIPVEMPLREEDGFLPVLSSISGSTWHKVKLLFVNYPNNPTASVADHGFFEELVHYARKHEVVLVHDNAYSEITYNGYSAPSLLEVNGAMETAIEFHSLSKTYNMTGWRIGFAVGGKDIIAPFAKVKENVDSGVFNAVQLAAVAALEGPQDCVRDNIAVYQRRRDILLEALRSIGWEVPTPQATLYVWMKVPRGYDSHSFTGELLERAAIVVAPGSAYGSYGEGYIRFSLTLPDQRLLEGVDRIKRAFS